MKKTLLNACAIIAACATIVLGSCSQSEFDGRTDTVYSLETPSVSAKAYPGVNFVSWKPVTGAISYKVTVYEEGAYKGIPIYVGDYSCYDTNLTNGKNYTYYVEAVSNSNPAREVYAKNSRGEASAKAIVPPAGTKSLELPAYEGGYDGTNTKEVKDDKWVIASDNIKVTVAEKKVSVNLPMKAYLKYGIKSYKDDLPHELIYDSDEKVEFNRLSDENANNVLGLRSFNITEAGKFQIAVKAFAYNGNYADSDEVIYGEITIPGLDLIDTTDADIKYTDKKTVRVSFTPAKDAKGADVPTSWYTIYRTEKGNYESTKITDVKTRNVIDKDGAVVAQYYIDDEVGENLAEGYYTYTIVVSNDGKYGKALKTELPKKELTLDSQTEVAASKMAYYVLDTNKFLTGADKTVRISFTPAKKDDEYVPTSWYSVYRCAKDDLKAEEVKITAAVKESNDTTNGTKYYVDDTVPDVTKSYTYTVVVTDGELYGAKATLTLNAKTIGSLNISVTGSFNGEKATWTISGDTEDAKLTAKYLVVPTGRNSDVPVLAQEILEKGTDATLVKVADSDDYTVEYPASSLKSDSATVYVLVQATQDGYKTENYISDAVYVSK